MKLSDIGLQRFLNQQIIATELTTAPEMVAWLGAIQAQEYAQTKWGLGIRLPLLKDADVEKDLNEGKILRTHLLRPTWHFVQAADLRWLLRLTASRVHAANAYMYRKMELDSAVFNRCQDILVKLLEGGKQLTRERLNEEFKKNKIVAEGHRLSYLMMHAELEEIICSGAREGNQFTYALLDERVRSFPTKTPDEGLCELTRRYFTSRGPATVKDFSTWSGLTLTDCKKGIQMLSSFLKEVKIENELYYFYEINTFNKKQEEQLRGIYLLPIYDEFIMGYKNRKAIFIYRSMLESVPPFHFDNMIVSEGQIIGTWKRTLKPKSVVVEPAFFKPPNERQRYELEQTILRYQEFTGLKIEL